MTWGFTWFYSNFCNKITSCTIIIGPTPSLFINDQKAAEMSHKTFTMVASCYLLNSYFLGNIAILRYPYLKIGTQKSFGYLEAIYSWALLLTMPFLQLHLVIQTCQIGEIALIFPLNLDKYHI